MVRAGRVKAVTGVVDDCHGANGVRIHGDGEGAGIRTQATRCPMRVICLSIARRGMESRTIEAYYITLWMFIMALMCIR